MMMMMQRFSWISFLLVSKLNEVQDCFWYSWSIVSHCMHFAMLDDAAVVAAAAVAVVVVADVAALVFVVE